MLSAIDADAAEVASAEVPGHDALILQGSSQAVKRRRFIGLSNNWATDLGPVPRLRD